MGGEKSAAKALSKFSNEDAQFFAGDVVLKGNKGESEMITSLTRGGIKYNAVKSKSIKPGRTAVCWLGVADDDVIGSYGVKYSSKQMGRKQHAVAKHTLNNRKISCTVLSAEKSSIQAYYKGKSFVADNLVSGGCCSTRKVDRYDIVVVDKDVFNNGIEIVTVVNTGKNEITLTPVNGFVEE